MNPPPPESHDAKRAKRHRDSQKRIYIDGAIYFITTNTRDRYPFFENDILCELFVKELEFCQTLQEFDLFGYKINPDHVHLLIRPSDGTNYSQIMGTLKRNFSRDANRLIAPEGDDPDRRLRENDRRLREHDDRGRADVEKFRQNIAAFIDEQGLRFRNEQRPRFKWQKSFHDHFIRDENDLHHHIEYIQNQWHKHNLPENKWCFSLTKKLIYEKMTPGELVAE